MLKAGDTGDEWWYCLGVAFKWVALAMAFPLGGRCNDCDVYIEDLDCWFDYSGSQNYGHEGQCCNCYEDSWERSQSDE